MDLRLGIEGLVNQLGDLEGAARALPNQNFADIVKAARARLAQLLDHADIENVSTLLAANLKAQEPPYDPRKPLEPDPEAIARMQAEDKARAAAQPFPGSEPKEGGADA